MSRAANPHHAQKTNLVFFNRGRRTERIRYYDLPLIKVAGTGDVGVWHATYVVAPGSYENIYVNMPPFGLGKVGQRARRPGR